MAETNFDEFKRKDCGFDFYFGHYRGLKLKISCGKFLNLAHYFPYDVKLRLLAHSRSFLANPKARNAIVGAENLLKRDIGNFTITAEIHARSLANFYCQYADRHMNLKLKRHVSERERPRQFADLLW